MKPKTFILHSYDNLKVTVWDFISVVQTNTLLFPSAMEVKGHVTQRLSIQQRCFVFQLIRVQMFISVVCFVFEVLLEFFRGFHNLQGTLGL